MGISNSGGAVNIQNNSSFDTGMNLNSTPI